MNTRGQYRKNSESNKYRQYSEQGNVQLVLPPEKNNQGS
jgi:hypothetical protein